jgi:metal-sulfur cluster biosynthetic enzyme
MDAIGLAPKILETLETIYDPELKPAMTLTAPNCPVAGDIMDEVQAKVAALEGINEALVELTFDPPWNRDMMTEEAKLELGLL